MERSFRGVLGLLAPAMVVLSMGPAIGSAAERSGKPRADGEQSDLFVAMQQGQVATSSLFPRTKTAADCW